MASITFAVRIDQDLGLLISSKTMVDLSRQRDSTATEDATKTLRVSQMAAAKVEAVLGSVGTYDDTDESIGDQTALDLGVRLALMYYSQIYTLTLTDAGRDMMRDVKDELQDEGIRRVQENSTPRIKNPDNDDLNARFKSSEWPDDDDTDGSQD